MKIFNLKKVYGNFELYIEQMELLPGLVYGIIGANGCGKTTLLRAVSGLDKNYEGYIDTGGLLNTDITIISKRPYLLHTSVYKNIIYPLNIRKINPADTDLLYLMDIFGFNGRGDEYAPGLSSGEQQKLSLIRAMVFSPKLIILDEALANLDIESVNIFEQYIKKKANNNITWVIVSHQLAHIRRFCSSVFFMKGGRIIVQGDSDDILLKCEQPFLKSFIENEGLIT